MMAINICVCTLIKLNITDVLSTLTIVMPDRNRFSGAIPSRIGQLTELEFLSFCKSDDIVIVYC